MLISFDGQVRNPRLLALLDLETDKQFAMVALIVINNLIVYFGLVEPVRIIQSANRSHVILHQRRRIAARGSIRGSLNSQSAGKKRRAEVLVAGKFHSDQAMAVSAVHMVGDDSGGGARRSHRFLRG